MLAAFGIPITREMKASSVTAAFCFCRGNAQGTRTLTFLSAFHYCKQNLSVYDTLKEVAFESIRRNSYL